MSLKNFMSYEDATTVIGAVKDAIDSAVSSAYHHAGTKTVAQLTHDLLVAANEGNVYNITDSGTTTSDFIEGIGKTIDEGSNVGICKVGNVYMFDLLSGFVDTTNFVQKSQTAGLLKNDGTVNDEIEDDVDSLKSGLTNVDVALSVPENAGKNLIPLSLASMKANNTSGTWADNVYSDSDITITVGTDASGNVTSITGDGTASARVDFKLCTRDELPLATGSYIISGSTGGSSSTWAIWMRNHGTNTSEMSTDGEGTIPYTSGTSSEIVLSVFSGAVLDDKAFYPMLRPATITDPTFAPYIPSVESRIEAVESGLTSIFLPTSRLTAVNDLDDVIKPGAYYFRDADNPANAPASNCYIAVIRQYDNSPRIAQIAYSFSVNTIYVRKTLDWGSTWGDWYSLDNTQVTQ